MNWDKTDIEAYCRLNDRFSEFAHMLGMDTRHPFIDQIRYQRHISVAQEDRDYVSAWVAWRLAFGHDQTLLWMKRGAVRLISPLDDVASFIDKLGKLAPQITHRANAGIHTATGMMVVASSINYLAGRGMGFRDLIIEGGVKGSKLLHDVMAYNMPTLTINNAQSRIIFLEKKLIDAGNGFVHK